MEEKGKEKTFSLLTPRIGLDLIDPHSKRDLEGSRFNSFVSLQAKKRAGGWRLIEVFFFFFFSR
jgi:hypothetical protein